jgi:hypothetical protein
MLLESIKTPEHNAAESLGIAMIKTYIRVELSSEGESPKQVIERMRRIDALPVVGDYDFELDLGDDERLFDKLEEIHHTLRGSSVRYTVTTRTDIEEEEAILGKNERSITQIVDQKPSELKKKVYRAKLDRWREMGLDVSELDALLEEDIEHFKDASKEFLRTHLDCMSVVKDTHMPENVVDGEVLALLDEAGKSIDDIKSLTGYSEDRVTLSLGRLISAGSATRCQRNSSEVYCMVPPPAPPTRTPLKIIQAETQEEAEERICMAIPSEGATREQVSRSSRLPQEQISSALASLSKKGSVRVVRKGKKATFYRT